VSGLNISRKKLLLGLSLGMVSLGFMYVKWPQHKVSADPAQQILLLLDAPKKFASMPLLMRAGMQQEFDFLKSTLSENTSLDERKMNAISTSAGRMDNLARELGTYEHDMQTAGRPREDLQYFRDRVLMLDHIAQDMQVAALRQDTAHMNAAVKQMEQTCSQCHLRFGVKTDGGRNTKRK
jgi:hypothetical protein